MRGCIQRRVNKNGTVSWSVIVYLPKVPGGEPRPKRLPSCASKKEADALLARTLHEINTDAFLEPSNLSVGEWLDQWLLTIEPRLRPSTHILYARIVRLHLAPALGHIPLAKLSPVHIERQYAIWLAAGMHPSTVRNIHTRLSTALTKAVRQKLIPSHPAAAGVVDAPRVRMPETKVWTAEEARTFLDATSEDRLGPLWRIALETGMRRGELLALRWEDVDFERATLAVQRAQTMGKDGPVMGETKTASSRRQIALSEACVAALRRHRDRQHFEREAAGVAWQENGLVFTAAAGGPVPTNSLRREWVRGIERAGVPYMRLHDARHTHATLLLAAEVNPKIVQERLGHSSIVMTLNRYSHATMDMQRSAVDRLSSLLNAAEQAAQ